MCGICNPDLRQILVVATEQETTIRKGQALGSVSTVLELREESHVPLEKNITDLDVMEAVSLVHLSEEQRGEVTSLLKSYKDVFTLSKERMSQASVTEHEIRLYDDTPNLSEAETVSCTNGRRN